MNINLNISENQYIKNILVAFDQATYNTGFSVWNIDSKELIYYGEINISKGNVNDRINHIKHIIEDEIYNKIKQYNIKFVFEDIQLQEEKENNYISFSKSSSKVNNVKTFKSLAWLQGVLLDFCLEKKIDFKLIFSSSWKSYCDIKGSTRAVQKQNSINFVKEKFNIDVNSDQADAICLGWTAVNKIE